MAKTINKEKASTARGRIAASAETDSVSDLSKDEAQNVENVTPEDDDLDTVNSADTASESSADDDLALSPATHNAIARRSSAGVSRASIPAPLMANPVTRFIAESYIELRKVTWPTWNQAWTMTLIVIVMSAFVAAILGLADLGLVRILTWIVGLGSH